MGLTTTAPLVLPTRRVLAFTSSTTWTVPTSALYVDGMVVGGGVGGQGSGISSNSGNSGQGGAVTVLKDIYLGGTGTVSIVVGAGSNGTTGVSTAATGAVPSAAGYSGFGTYVYSQGGLYGNQSNPGYKGTTNSPYVGRDTNPNNFAPILTQSMSSNTGGTQYGGLFTTTNTTGYFYNPSNYGILNQASTSDGTGYGLAGGLYGYTGGLNSPAGFSYGVNGVQTAMASLQIFGPSAPLPWGASTVLTLGTATAGGNSSNGRVGGLAGNTGYAGGGGSNYGASPWFGVCGAQGAGGGGANCDSAGGTGGNGGNAGTNTGAGGGIGGFVNQTSGTGGNGGNGAAGFVIVSYVGTN